MKTYRRFSYQGSQRTRFGYYGPSGTPGHVTRHEFGTRKERDTAWKRVLLTLQVL